jgi:hypothetical protein
MRNLAFPVLLGSLLLLLLVNEWNTCMLHNLYTGNTTNRVHPNTAIATGNMH